MFICKYPLWVHLSKLIYNLDINFLERSFKAISFGEAGSCKLTDSCKLMHNVIFTYFTALISTALTTVMQQGGNRRQR